MGWKDKIKVDQNGKQTILADKELIGESALEISQPKIEIKKIKRTNANDKAGAILKLIKDRRKKLGINQDEMAKVIGWSRESYLRLESGSALMGIKQLAIVLSHLNITLQ